MKRINSIWVIVLIITAGCGRNGQVEEIDGYITVDVTGSYPKKEQAIQDIMDVEYILLETTDEFLTQGVVQAIGKDIIIVTNRPAISADIFIFDRKTGKALKKINRQGQGGEEYIRIFSIMYDERSNEMFVIDVWSRKIFVYNLEGKFKRSFRHKEGTLYNVICNFDQRNLLVFDRELSDFGVRNKQQFAVISKQDGSVTREINFIFEDKKTDIVQVRVDNGTYSNNSGAHFPIRSYNGTLALVELSSDTIYRYLPDHKMIPMIVRTPSVQSMFPEVFLVLSALSDRYYFMKKVRKVFDFTKREGFPSVDLMYDKQEMKIFEYTFYNDDYESKRPVSLQSRYVGDEIVAFQVLEAYQLVADYQHGLLKGRLKEIAAELDVEDNPVIMMMKEKK